MDKNVVSKIKENEHKHKHKQCIVTKNDCMYKQELNFTTTLKSILSPKTAGTVLKVNISLL